MGILEAIKVRKKGFSSKYDYQTFYKKYKEIEKSPHETNNENSFTPSELSRRILLKIYNPDDEQFKHHVLFGKELIYFKEPIYNKLNDCLWKIKEEKILKILKFFRNSLLKKKINQRIRFKIDLMRKSKILKIIKQFRSYILKKKIKQRICVKTHTKALCITLEKFRRKQIKKLNEIIFKLLQEINLAIELGKISQELDQVLFKKKLEPKFQYIRELDNPIDLLIKIKQNIRVVIAQKRKKKTNIANLNIKFKKDKGYYIFSKNSSVFKGNEIDKSKFFPNRYLLKFEEPNLNKFHHRNSKSQIIMASKNSTQKNLVFNDFSLNSDFFFFINMHENSTYYFSASNEIWQTLMNIFLYIGKEELITPIKLGKCILQKPIKNFHDESMLNTSMQKISLMFGKSKIILFYSIKTEKTGANIKKIDSLESHCDAIESKNENKMPLEAKIGLGKRFEYKNYKNNVLKKTKLANKSSVFLEIAKLKIECNIYKLNFMRSHHQKSLNSTMAEAKKPLKTSYFCSNNEKPSTLKGIKKLCYPNNNLNPKMIPLTKFFYYKLEEPYKQPQKVINMFSKEKKNLQKKIFYMQNELSKKNAHENKLLVENQTLQHRIDLLNNEFSKNIEENKKLSKENQILQSNIDSLKNQIFKKNEDVIDNQALQIKLNFLEKELSKMTENDIELSDEIRNMQNRMEFLKNELSNCKEENIKLIDENRHFQTKIDDLQFEISKKNEDQSKLASENQNLQIKLSSSQIELSKMNEDNALLLDKNQALKISIDSLQKEHSSRNEDDINLLAENRNFQNMILSLKNMLSNKNEDNDKLFNDNQNLEIKIDSLQNELSKKNEANTEFLHENKTLQKAIEYLRNELSKAFEENIKLSDENRNLEIRIDSLTNEISNPNKDIELTINKQTKQREQINLPPNKLLHQDLKNLHENKLKDSGFDLNKIYYVTDIAKGGYGRVLLAVYVENKEIINKFAIKKFEILMNSLNSNEITKEDVVREINLLNFISKLPFQPRTLPTYYGNVSFQFSDREECFLYSKFENASIDKYFGKILPSIGDLRNIISQLINTFAFLQLKGLCHQDLKPQNILLRVKEKGMMQDIKITVIDFGIAKLFEENSLTKQNWTGNGTESYYSPEKRKINYSKDNEKANINVFKSDVFSLGLVMVELLIGKRIKGYIKTREWEKEIKNALKEINKKLNEAIIFKSSESSQKKEVRDMVSIIGEMLVINPEERKDFIQLLFYALPLFKLSNNKIEKMIVSLVGEKKSYEKLLKLKDPDGVRFIRNSICEKDQEIEFLKNRLSISIEEQSKSFEEEKNAETIKKKKKKMDEINKKNNYDYT